MADQVFVIGPDPFNQQRLAEVAQAAGVTIQPLLRYEDVRGEAYPLHDLLRRAEAEVRAAAEPPDALVGFWDFPVSDMVPILCRDLGLRGPDLEAVVRCEDKYWSRLEQRKVIPDCVPRFSRFDPFAADPLAQIDLDFPFWVKPIKAWRSQLGFRIGDEADFREAVGVIREHIERLSEPFNELLAHLDLPQGIPYAEGGFCLAEEIIGGHQCTLEGYSLDGEVTVYGVVDSIRYANDTTFSRYQYPSHLPPAVQARMIAKTKAVIAFLGLDNTTFNVEFFYDDKRDRTWLLEINPRISQSHSDLFAKVDGYSNLRILTDVALGRPPQRRAGSGEFACAAKYFLRQFENAYVAGVPSVETIADLQRELPGTLVEIEVEAGMTLSDLPGQDSYSYELGFVCVGAADPRQLLERIRWCEEHLAFDLRPVA
jgi:biotin carboxylase